MVTDDVGAKCADLTAGLPDRFVDSITVDASNPSVAYLTVSGYRSGHVFKTTNDGAAWADISANLPNTPANALLVDPSNASVLYLGTDVGVFRSTNGGASWETFNAGMPPTVVTAFSAQDPAAGGRIRLATYGRGVYELTSAAADSVVSFAAAAYATSETEGRVRLTVSRTEAAQPAAVDYATADGTATQRSDYAAAFGTLRFAAGEASKSFDVFVTRDALAEPAETFTVTLSNPSGATLGAQPSAIVTVGPSAAGANPALEETFNAAFFVRQHYLDFLNREPDEAGLAYWVGQIAECAGRPEAERRACRDVRRTNVSAAFFLSPEFQETGFYVLRVQRAASGRRSQSAQARVTYEDFLRAARQVGDSIVAGQPGAAERLERNKQAYAEQLAAGTEFLARFPVSLTREQYVNQLFAAAGVAAPATAELNEAVNAYGAGGLPARAAALRRVADSPSVRASEFRPAFVLMQYFGYLRRNPTDAPDTGDAGYQFWLRKLDEFGGDYVSAEMVKAFITSGEYLQRFGQP